MLLSSVLLGDFSFFRLMCTGVWARTEVNGRLAGTFYSSCYSPPSYFFVVLTKPSFIDVPQVLTTNSQNALYAISPELYSHVAQQSIPVAKIERCTAAGEVLSSQTARHVLILLLMVILLVQHTLKPSHSM